MTNEGRLKVGSSFPKIGANYLRIGTAPDALAYLLLGNFYADSPSFSVCQSDGTLISNVALAAPITEASSGSDGLGFICTLTNGLCKVYDRDGVEQVSFDVNSGGTAFPFPANCTAIATRDYIYVQGSGSTYTKRFTLAGAFVSQDSSLPTNMLAGRVGQADEFWTADVDATYFTVSQYINFTAAGAWDVLLSLHHIANVVSVDIDEDGYLYALVVRDDGGGFRVLKVNLADGLATDLIASNGAGESSYTRLSVGGRHNPTALAASLLYVSFEGVTPGTDGFVQIRSAADGSLLSTVSQSGGTDPHFGIARMKNS